LLQYSKSLIHFQVGLGQNNLMALFRAEFSICKKYLNMPHY